MKSNAAGRACGLVALSLVLGALPWVQAQEASAPAGESELQVGPATVAPHWSRYKYPETIPDGATYYLIKRGDTLWDLAARFLGNPFLWPQIWDQNRYITDAHWIYPGDPLIIPRVGVVSDRAGLPGEEGTGGAERLDEEAGQEAGAVGERRSLLEPAITEMQLQCAHYILDDPEDPSLHVIGSEDGDTKLAFGDRDILYLSKGSNAGVKAGDVFSLQHVSYWVKHPETGRTIGRKIETTGWGRVVLVQEDSSTLMVERACMDVHLGDYAKPFQKAVVPMIVPRPPGDRLTPPSGKTDGTVVDIAEDSMIAGQEQLVSINLGSANGVAPGNIFSVYRIMYPTVPTARNVLGEIVVVAVRERTATARVSYSRDAIMAGDRVELR
ncbi:MAG TPA: LysM peptidoglycan-binding domain-containing protein [Vicinamibacteria bacterium]|nr:LysM peptidoglycan-binding domain-containing protein [Vicinamibacteria bacterium]